MEMGYEVKERNQGETKALGLEPVGRGMSGKRGADSRALLGYFSCHKMKNKK